MQMREYLRHVALLEPQGNDRWWPLRRPCDRLESKSYLPMHEAIRPHRRSGEADDHAVRAVNCALDLEAPVLARQEVLFVQPGVETIVAKPLIEYANSRLVLRGMAKEDHEW